jgi:FlaA1/EpsC-like NDP-sugar epimerase
MGATKKLMEETIMAYSNKLPIKTARFANVAFSNGSLPLGWINRIQKKQPIVCPVGVRRFFVSPVESGELCLFASVMAESGDIVYPKLDPVKDMISFDSFLPDFLKETGHNDWDVRYPEADTDGEKPYEEFFTADDIKDEKSFINLGVVKDTKRRSVDEVEGIINRLREVFVKNGVRKEDIVGVLREYLPNFHHCYMLLPQGCMLPDRPSHWGHSHNNSRLSSSRKQGCWALSSMPSHRHCWLSAHCCSTW